ncbi:glycoside hydrolase family 61 protein [Apiospora saccharicola]|uniref:lytic cellulose monooxygenase (C4-dehydrogenating) n=1 Tax=Apiospora saccharicola TaxID=335842 RepID=A0ABR1WE19_9PEZI
MPTTPSPAPSGATAESFDGSGNVWFKIYQDGPSFAGGQITWPSAGKKEVSVQIPRCLPDGYYLLRAEHIALHSAGSVGGAQFYIGCAQLHVTGGTGTVTPSGVSFPGAYKATDRKFFLHYYDPPPRLLLLHILRVAVF